MRRERAARTALEGMVIGGCCEKRSEELLEDEEPDGDDTELLFIQVFRTVFLHNPAEGLRGLSREAVESSDLNSLPEEPSGKPKQHYAVVVYSHR